MDTNDGARDRVETISTADHDWREDRRALTGGGLLNAAGLAVNGALTFLLVVVVTRGLTPARAGVFLEAIALFSILSNLVEFGADDGLLRFVPRLRAQGRSRELRPMLVAGLGPLVVVGAVAGAILFVVAPALSRGLVHGSGLRSDALVPYLRVLAPFLPLSALSRASLAASRGFGTMVPNAAVGNVLGPALRLTLVWLALVAGLGTAAVALAWAVPIAVTLAAVLVWIERLLVRGGADPRPSHAAGMPGTPDAAPSLRRLAAEFWRFAAPRGLSATFGITVTWLDTLLIGAILTTREAGIYAAAGRYLALGYLAIGPIQLILAPMISRLLAQADQARAGAVYRTATQWAMVLSWPLYLSVAVFAPLALRVFGRSYQEGQTALLILAIAGMVNMTTGPCLTVLLMGGKSGWTLAVSAVSLSTNVVLNLLLIPRWGIEGAAIAWAVSIGLVNLSGFVLVRRLMGLSPFSAGVPLVAAAALVSYGGIGLAARMVSGASIPTFVVAELAASAVYLSILYAARSRLDLPLLRGALRSATRSHATP